MDESTDTLREKLARAGLTDPQRLRWTGLIDRYDTVAEIQQAVLGHCPPSDAPAVGAPDLVHARRLLGSITSKVVLFGPSGAGKSSIIDALAGRVAVPAGASTAVTSVVVYVHLVGPGEPEGVVVTYLTRAELHDRVRRLATGVVGPFDPLSGTERRKVITRLRELGAEPTHRDGRQRRIELLHQVLRALDGREDKIADGAGPVTDPLPLGDPRVLALLTEPPMGDPDQVPVDRLGTRLVRSATVSVVPAGGGAALRGVQFVDVPGEAGNVELHSEVAAAEMARDDAVVLLVPGKISHRVDGAPVQAAVDLVSSLYLSTLTGTARDDAAAKFFCVLNDDDVSLAHLDDPKLRAAVGAVLTGLSRRYAQRYAGRGRGRPYFVVRPLDSLMVENRDEALADTTSKAPYATSLRFGAARLGATVDPDAGPVAPELAGRLLEASEIPLLRERLLAHLRDQRVNTLLNQVAAHLAAAVADLTAAVRTRLVALGVDADAPLQVPDLERRLAHAHLRTLRSTLPDRLGELLDGVASAHPVADDAVRAQAREPLDQLAQRHRQIVEPFFVHEDDPLYGHHFDDDRPPAAAKALEKELPAYIEKVGRELARRHVRALDAGLAASDLTAALAEEARGLPDPLDTDAELRARRAEFERDHTAAVAAAVVYEYGRDDSRSLIKRVTDAQEGKDAPADLEGWLARLNKEIEQVIGLVLDGPELRQGLSVVFVTHWRVLRAQVADLAVRVVEAQSDAFATSEAYRAVLLERIGEGFTETRELLALRARLDALVAG